MELVPADAVTDGPTAVTELVIGGVCRMVGSAAVADTCDLRTDVETTGARPDAVG